MELTINNLTVGYISRGGRREIVRENIDLTLKSGEVTCLLGLNGVGKSTLLRTVCRFQKKLSGEILLDGKNIDQFSQIEYATLIGVVLTDRTNVGGITVYELVSLGRQPHTGFFGHLNANDRAIVTNAISAVGMSDKASKYVSELSDGERQKAMIAKTLAQECPIMILDEPTAFLDATSRIETMILLRKLAKEQNKAILLSTHDLDNALKMADRIWLMGNNLDTVSGTPDELIDGNLFPAYFEREGIIFDKTTKSLKASNERID
ncbi:MAG: ABC transporter ATP-binding protein [Bacteroidales bacterium]|nr:ABC transporter ATP-binding protein [Bacteroidales bacterium]